MRAASLSQGLHGWTCPVCGWGELFMSGKPGCDLRRHCGPVTQPNHSGGSLSPPPPPHTVHSLQYMHSLKLPVFAHPCVLHCTYMHSLVLPVLTHPYLLAHYVLIEYIRCSGWSLACCCACPSLSLMLPTPPASSLTHSFVWPTCSSFISLAYAPQTLTHSLN